MIETGYFLLAISAILPVIASGLLFFWNKRFESRLSYATRQIIIGIIFGGLAILGTEWGISVKGLIVNCRDAAPLCAGLLFGGPAGIIAGFIGGIERFVAVAWGAGTYTQIACSVSTILAGFYAAAIRRYPLDNNRPNWAIGFLSGLVMESFHMLSVVVTHLDDIPTSLHLILICAPTMLTACSISVMLATIVVNIAARNGMLRVPREEKSVRQTFQSGLLICFVIAFSVFSGLGYVAETIVYKTANYQYLEHNLTSIKELNLEYVTDYLTPSSDNTTGYKRLGNNGYILISQMPSGEIISAPYELYGKTMDEVGLGQAAEINPAPYTANATNCSYLYNVTVNGTECECMDSYVDSYRITAVYPTEEGYLDRDRSFILTLLIQILLFAVVFALTDRVIYKYVVNPIRNVNKSLQDITDGNLNTVVNVQSNLEFVLLSDGINTTVNALQKYTHEAQQRMEEELELACNIQHSALPKHFPPYPGRKEFDIFACMDTAKEVGGDFYDFFFTKRNTFCFLIADVSGKGIPAAMFMMRAKTLIKDLSEAGVELSEVVKRTNEQLCEDNESGMFLTLWLGSIDLTTGLVTYVNAGHNAPLIRHQNETAEFINSKHCFVLGITARAKYICQKFLLNKGDTLYLYTDGVSEAMNSTRELFGNDRLSASVANARFSSVEELCASIRTDLDAFVDGAPQADDITMLALKYRGFNQEDSLIIPAKLENMRDVTDFLVDTLNKHHADQNSIRKVSVVVDEIFNNIASYAYPDSEGDVEIRSSVEHIDQNDSSTMVLNMSFIDSGQAFNPLEQNASSTQAPAYARMNGGYGIMIVRKLMDSVEYRRDEDKNVFSMTMSFSLSNSTDTVDA